MSTERLNGIFPKCFQWIQWQKYLSLKGLKHATSCVRNQDTTTMPARHIWETESLNWVQFILQWFIRLPKFTEFNESFAPFRKNSNGLSGLMANSDLNCSYGAQAIKKQRGCGRPSPLAVCPWWMAMTLALSLRDLMHNNENSVNVTSRQLPW